MTQAQGQTELAVTQAQGQPELAAAQGQAQGQGQGQTQSKANIPPIRSAQGRSRRSHGPQGWRFRAIRG